MSSTVQFGTRAHHVDDAAAAAIIAALRARETVVIVPIDLGGDGTLYNVTLHVPNIVALIEHRARDERDMLPLSIRARAALQAFEDDFNGAFARCDIDERRAVLERLTAYVARAAAANREPES
jgi:hypothetical protein